MRILTTNTLSLALFVSVPSYSEGIEHIPVMLAQTYQPSADHKTFWVSEKLDGIRAIWTGKKLLTRAGNQIKAPDWFIQNLPTFALDGELWAGYDQFNLVQSTVLSETPNDLDWKNIHYYIFDRPIAKLTFEQRYQSLQKWFQRHVNNTPQHLHLLEYQILRDNQHIQQRLNQILAQGGEGIVLRSADSLYVNGRDRGMLKLKPYLDAEAQVIGYRKGKGKYHNLVGALIVKDNQGHVFALGSGLDENTRKNPPQIGERVTFRFQGVTKNGKPRFARFLRVRHSNDISSN
jgi:DNA ligase 1